MELIIKGQFYRDLSFYNRDVLFSVKEVIKDVQKSKKVSEIQNLKKLREYKIHYRIRVADDYRIDIIIRGNTIWFSRFGNRAVFYKKFP